MVQFVALNNLSINILFSSIFLIRTWIIVIPLLVVFSINVSTLHNALMLFVITFIFTQKLTALSTPLWEKPLSFGEVIPDFEMTLSMTTHQPMEGYWVLELWHKPRNELVYLLTFCQIGRCVAYCCCTRAKF